MSSLLQVSQTYSGRDKLLRTTGYLSVFLTGALNPQGKLARDLATIAKHTSAARTVMRFFDDLPMLKVTLASINSKEADWPSKLLSIIGNVAIQAYFPVEKIAWAADNQIITLKSGSQPWWYAGIALWAVFLLTNILKIMRAIGLLRARRVALIKKRKLESPEKSSEAEIEFRRAMAESKQQEFAQLVNFVKLAADMVMAVNWLPPGFLWAGKIAPAKNAFFGCISSLIGVLQLMYAPK